jgi:hypothetical protein
VAQRQQVLSNQPAAGPIVDEYPRHAGER